MVRAFTPGRRPRRPRPRADRRPRAPSAGNSQGTELRARRPRRDGPLLGRRPAARAASGLRLARPAGRAGAGLVLADPAALRSTATPSPTRPPRASARPDAWPSPTGWSTAAWPSTRSCWAPWTPGWARCSSACSPGRRPYGPPSASPRTGRGRRGRPRPPAPSRPGRSAGRPRRTRDEVVHRGGYGVTDGRTDPTRSAPRPTPTAATWPPGSRIYAYRDDGVELMPWVLGQVGWPVARAGAGRGLWPGSVPGRAGRAAAWPATCPSGWSAEAVAAARRARRAGRRGRGCRSGDGSVGRVLAPHMLYHAADPGGRGRRAAPGPQRRR